MGEVERAALVAQYAAGATYADVARANDVSPMFVRRLLVSAGVLRESVYRNRLTDWQKQLIIDGYKAGKTCEVVSAEVGIKGCSAWEFLSRRGLTRGLSESHRKYSMDHAAFDAVTPESAYWIGFLMTDGYVMAERFHFGVQVAEKDAAHLESFRRFLKAGHPVRRKEPGRYEKSFNSGVAYRFDAISQRIVDSLARYGVTPRKTHTAKVVGLEMNSHFWRGCVDGDGSVSLLTDKAGRTRPSIRLCGASADLLEQFAAFVRAGVAGCSASLVRGRHTWSVTATDNHAVRLADILYANAPVALPRKAQAGGRVAAWVGRRTATRFSRTAGHALSRCSS